MKTFCLIWILILLILNLFVTAAVLSKINAMTEIYNTVESFKQEVKQTRNSLIDLDADLTAVINRSGTANILLKEYINLTRAALNHVDRFIQLQEEEEE